MQFARTIAAAAMSLIVACLAPAGDAAPLAYLNETATRLVSAPGLGVSDIEEKDYAWGDVNNDGRVDLVVVRRQPWGIGKRPNVLFMNEAGVLTDRTVQYASTAINLPDGVSDLGFQTPTCDTDVVLADVNLDGWLDIITAVIGTAADPKHIGHPRIYINRGVDESGSWLGFVFDNARIPQMLSNPTCLGCAPQIANPFFFSVAAGDVNGDGAPELYFGDGDILGISTLQPAELDFNQKLLQNDGRGLFSDVTTHALQGQVTLGGPSFPIWLSYFGAASAIADMNDDGANDIIWNEAISPYIAIAYNDPKRLGIFAGQAQVVFFPSQAPYFVSVADLNGDGRLDLVETDDNVDRYRLARGVGSSGQTAFGPTSFFPSATVGFGGASTAADLNRDGFNDVLIADVDVTISGCSRTADIMVNNANPPNVTFTVNSGGIPNSMLTGVHHFAVFDINNDGWLDLVVGRCASTQVWIFDAPAPVPIGDLSGDGLVDSLDLDILLSSWSIPAGAPGCGGAKSCPADLNADGRVDSLDLGILLSSWTL